MCRRLQVPFALEMTSCPCYVLRACLAFMVTSVPIIRITDESSQSVIGKTSDLVTYSSYEYASVSVKLPGTARVGTSTLAPASFY